MTSNFLIIATFFKISLTILTVNAVTNSTETGNARRSEAIRTLIRDAGCKSGGRLLAKGACIESDYDKESPQNSTHQLISFTFMYSEIVAINEMEKKVSFNIGFIKEWYDNRVKTNFPYLSENTWYGTTYGIKMPWYKIEKQFPLWRPIAILFKEVTDRKLLHEPASLAFVGNEWISNTTYVAMAEEYELTKFCEFDFSRFPMDTQKCRIRLHNMYESELDLELYDPDGKYHKPKESQKLGYDITVSFDSGHITDKAHNASYVGINFLMRRNYRPFVIQYYVPCIGIVIVSQVSFIIPASCIPGRVGLVATQFLTLTNIFISEMVRYDFSCKTFHSLLRPNF